MIAPAVFRIIYRHSIIYLKPLSLGERHKTKKAAESLHHKCIDKLTGN